MKFNMMSGLSSKQMIGMTLLAIVLVALSITINALLWGVIGWFIGLFASDIILGWFANIGITNITMFQLFAILGIIQSILFGGSK